MGNIKRQISRQKWKPYNPLTHRIIEIGSYSVPGELLDLERDITRLGEIRQKLRALDPRNVCEEGMSDIGYRFIIEIDWMISLCQRAAELKRKEFLK